MIDADVMIERVRAWASINSHSANVAGLTAVLDAVEPAFARLGACDRVPLPAVERVEMDGAVTTFRTAPALRVRCRPDAPRQALLVIHVDTVYPVGSSFQTVMEGDGQFNGPGVLDAKGGLAVMLSALESFEADRPGDDLGWTVVLNPDEEIGSPASAGLLRSEAERAAAAPGGGYGLVFEPALPNGDLVGQRKGSGNYQVLVTGRSAHAGRDFFEGRNAVVVAAGLAVRLAGLTDAEAGTTVNVSAIGGGGPTNVVPGSAVVHANARVVTTEAATAIDAAIRSAAADMEADGIAIAVHGGMTNPPKMLDDASAALFERLRSVASYGFAIGSSGGVCDGNKLAAAGLPVIDTLGPVGGCMHSTDEYLELASLVPRAEAAAALLRSLAG